VFAPWEERSLLRRLLGVRGATLMVTHGQLASEPCAKTQRPVLRVPASSSARRPSPSTNARAPAVATRRSLAGKPLVVCGIVASALWCGGPALADETPAPPPVTTTVPDAPPPDPYKAPSRAAKPKPAPRRVAPAVRLAPTAPARTYTPPAAVTPRQTVQAPRTKPQRRAKVVRKQRTRREAPAVSVSLAPLAEVIAAARVPLVVDRDRRDPYLWLAGVAFAVLAATGLGLVMQTIRFYRPRWE